MATTCAHCGSADTAAGLDTYQCHNCGRLSTYSGEKAEGGYGASTRAALEARLAPRQNVVVGNLADLQRSGAEAAANGKTGFVAGPPPGLSRDDVVTPAEADAARGEYNVETERTGKVKAPAAPEPPKETDKQTVTNTAPTGGRAPGSVTNVSTGAEVKATGGKGK